MFRGGAEEEKNGTEEKEEVNKKIVWPLAVFPLIFPCLYYVTHADLRYRHPIDPVVCLLTAVAVAQAFVFASGRRKGAEP